MRKHTIRYLRRAQDDLVGIVDYIGRHDADAAIRLVQELDSTLGRLSEVPESGAVARDPRLAAKGYRVVVFGNYLAFYRLIHFEVRIARVLHGRRRYERLL